MAVQEQNPNQLLELAQVFRRRAGQVLLPAGVVLALAYSLATLLPRKYEATTSLELRESTLPLAGTGFDAKAIQRDVSNTPWQIKQFERVRRVVEKLEWDDYNALSPVDQNEYIRDLLADITVPTPPKSTQQGGSVPIVIKFLASDPQRAEQFLNRLREAYTTEVLDRFRNDARKMLQVLVNQKQQYEEEARRKDEEAAKVKKEAGVSATQQAPGGGRQRDEDPLFTRKAQAQDGLRNVLAQIASDAAALAALQQQFKETPPEVSEATLLGGVSFDDEIAKIDEEIATQRESQQGITRLHHEYARAELKIEQLEQKKRQLIERATSPAAQTTMKPNPLRADLLTQIQAKELALRQSEGLKVQLESDVKTLTEQCAKLVDTYGRIQALDREAQIASDNYKNAAAAYDSQKRFVDAISEGFANPFEVTELARAPTEPASPSQILIIGGGLVLGLGLGGLWAAASEFGRNGFRGPADAARILSVPVLGAVNRIRTRAERRALSARRALVGASTLALIAAIFWITWAYEARPQVLGHDLVGAIDRLREAFR